MSTRTAARPRAVPAMPGRAVPERGRASQPGPAGRRGAASAPDTRASTDHHAETASADPSPPREDRAG